MPAPKVPDSEFIELWKTLGGATGVAKKLDVALSAVHRRRRHLERKHRITLEGTARPDKSGPYKQLAPEEHKANHHLGIENGTIIVGSDAHIWPGIRTTAFKAFLKFTKEMQPKVVVLNGDVFDGASISRHPRIGWEKAPSVIDELNAVKAALDEIEDIAPKAKKVWPVGNHCARFASRLAANAPEYAGVHGTQLKDHFPAWTPCWAAWANDQLVIKHRMRSGVHATHNNTVNSGVSIVTGHLHSLKVTPFSDYNGTRFGVDSGCLADTSGPQFVNYTEAGPLNWRSGFVVLTMWKGKLLWPELVHVISPGKVEFRGLVLDVSGE